MPLVPESYGTRGFAGSDPNGITSRGERSYSYERGEILYKRLGAERSEA